MRFVFRAPPSRFAPNRSSDMTPCGYCVAFVRAFSYPKNQQLAVVDYRTAPVFDCVPWCRSASPQRVEEVDVAGSSIVVRTKIGHQYYGSPAGRSLHRPRPSRCCHASFCANSSASAMLTWSVRKNQNPLSSITIQVSRSREQRLDHAGLVELQLRGVGHIEEPVRSRKKSPSTPSALITYSHCGSSAAMITVMTRGRVRRTHVEA